MAYDNIIAEVIGGTLSGLRFLKQGWVMVLQVAVTGIALAHFVGADVARMLLQYTAVSISYGAALFLVSYLGTTVLNKILDIVKNFDLKKIKIG